MDTRSFVDGLRACSESNSSSGLRPPSPASACGEKDGRVGLSVLPLRGRAGVRSANASGLMHALRAQHTAFRAQHSVIRAQNTAFRTQHSVIRVQNSAFRAQSYIIRVQNSVFRTQSSIVRVQNSVFRAQSSIVRVQNSAFRAQSSVVRVQLQKGIRSKYQRPLLALKACVLSLKRGLCRKLNESFSSATSRPAIEAKESGAQSNYPLRSNRFFLRRLILLLSQ